MVKSMYPEYEYSSGTIITCEKPEDTDNKI